MPRTSHTNPRSGPPWKSQGPLRPLPKQLCHSVAGVKATMPDRFEISTITIEDEAGTVLISRPAYKSQFYDVQRSLRGSGTVFRVERSHTGEGPFRSIPGLCVMIETALGESEAWETRRCPQNDDIPTWSEYVYGIPGIEEFFHWFGEVLDVLKGEGYVLKKYWTDHYFIGREGNQVSFIKERSVLLEEIPI